MEAVERLEGTNGSSERHEDVEAAEGVTDMDFGGEEPPRRLSSALQENILQKGENAYYYAHSRKFEVPENATVVSGPGLVTGGAPVRLGVEKIEVEDVRSEIIQDFSWADDGHRAKIYVQLPPRAMCSSPKANCEFSKRAVSLTVDCSDTSMVSDAKPSRAFRYVCKIDPLNADVVPAECSHHMNDKGKVTIVLHKKVSSKWYDLKKKI